MRTAAIPIIAALNADAVGFDDWTQAALAVAFGVSGPGVPRLIIGNCKGFFAVHDAVGGSMNMITLTHLPTGRALARGYDDASLRDLADVLAGMQDWDFTEQEPDTLTKAVKATVRAFIERQSGAA